MSGQLVAFCDANILFSAALGRPTFDLLLDLGRHRLSLITSRACVIEASVNLERKRPEALPRLNDVLGVIRPTAPEGRPHEPWAGDLIDPGDVHVLASARASGADVLITGDVTHFGALMARTDLPMAVRTLRGFLLEHPPPAGR